MPADESTAEVSRLLEQWDAINRSPLQLSAILAGDTVTDMASADGDTHLVAVLARLLLAAGSNHSVEACKGMEIHVSYFSQWESRRNGHDVVQEWESRRNGHDVVQEWESRRNGHDVVQEWEWEWKLLHSNGRVITFLKFLETWKCQGILQRSGKGTK